MPQCADTFEPAERGSDEPRKAEPLPQPVLGPISIMVEIKAQVRAAYSSAGGGPPLHRFPIPGAAHIGSPTSEVADVSRPPSWLRWVPEEREFLAATLVVSPSVT